MNPAAPVTSAIMAKILTTWELQGQECKER